MQTRVFGTYIGATMAARTFGTSSLVVRFKVERLLNMITSCP